MSPKRRSGRSAGVKPAGRSRSAPSPAACTPGVRWNRQLWVCRAALVAAIVVAFLPAFSADFVTWDDTGYVVNNQLLRSAAGLRGIWNPFAGNQPQYYPLVFTSYWLEYHLWGLAPAGYHATNIALHALNALLVLELLRALGASLWVAAGAAAVFALHPIQVESVVWVTERKNTLSGVFYLTAFLLYVRYRRTASARAYAGVLFAFGAALLSKSQTLTLPVMLLVTDRLLQRTGRFRFLPGAAAAARLLPLFALAVAVALATTSMERQVAHNVNLPALEERLLIAASAAWFYVAKFVAPFGLVPIYPRWNVIPSHPMWWLGVLGWVVLAPLAWRWRSGGLSLWGLVQFLVTLLPAGGIVQFNYQNFSYVADRFLYLSCIGGGVAAAALIERFSVGAMRRRLAIVVGMVVLAGYGVLTYRQALHWRSSLSFWTYTVARNPDSYPANINLGFHYARKAQWPRALPFFRKAHEVEPGMAMPLGKYLQALGIVRGPQAVIEACNERIERRAPNMYVAHLHRAESYAKLGRRAEALADYRRVLALTQRGSPAWLQARRAATRLSHGAGP